MDMFAKTASALSNSVVVYAIADICVLIRQQRDQIIRYPRIRRSRLSQLSDDFLVSAFHTISCTISVTCGCCINDYMKWHSCDEYLNRIENSGSALQNLPMQDLHDSYHNIVSEDSEAFSLSMRRSKSRRANGS
jgi:hypothetical protein